MGVYFLTPGSHKLAGLDPKVEHLTLLKNENVENLPFLFRNRIGRYVSDE